MKSCKFCGHEVASNAMTCPKCGATLKKKHGCLLSILAMLGVFVLIIISMFATGAISKVSEEDITATVITNSGETVKMTRNDLKKIYESNRALYDKEYHGAKISFEFTVSKVETNIYFGNTTSGTAYDRIKCKEALWNVLLIHDSVTNLHELEVGDRVYVESQIYGTDQVLSNNTTLVKIPKEDS